MRAPLSAVALTLLSTLTLLGLSSCGPGAGHSSVDPFAGVWRVEMEHPGGTLPFGLEVAPGGERAWILNPPERLEVESVTLDNGRLVVDFFSYGSQLVLEARGGQLSGEARLVRSDGLHARALSATRATHRFTPRPEAPDRVAGDWGVTLDGSRPQQGLGQFTVEGREVRGSIALESGDTRYLAGDVGGGVLRLSTFDGNATSLWIGRRTADGWEGERWTLTSREPVRWRATPLAGPTPDPVAVRTLEPQPFSLTLTDAQGQSVSLADPRYRGRVVVLAIGGAWCPNCHDEARFLGPYARRRQAEGLEVIGIQFEHGEGERVRRQLGHFQARYGLPYPLLHAGPPTPEATRAVFPLIDGIRVYPTTLVLDRSGRLVEIHEGWAGPATGRLHEEAKARFDATVSRLLAQPG